MAKLQFDDVTLTTPEEIKNCLGEIGVPFEHWGTKPQQMGSESDVFAAYESEIRELKTQRGYVSHDVVCLDNSLPNLQEICAKFDKEHHHTEDEVRFTVEGEGVFEINSEDNSKTFKFLAEPGDLIVIPASRRHSFYLTDQKKIRCIRLFKNQEGWQAIY
jgi:1,2-dihydroxy-3-keto-5-methylthiopentene dioxygenase